MDLGGYMWFGVVYMWFGITWQVDVIKTLLNLFFKY